MQALGKEILCRIHPFVDALQRCGAHLRMNLKMNLIKKPTPTALDVNTHGGHEAKKCIWRAFYSRTDEESTLVKFTVGEIYEI